MKDRAGNELKIGDRVLYLESGRSTSWMVWGVIDRFTPKMVVFKTDKYRYERRCPPNRVVKPFKEE